MVPWQARVTTSTCHESHAEIYLPSFKINSLKCMPSGFDCSLKERKKDKRKNYFFFLFFSLFDFFSPVDFSLKLHRVSTIHKIFRLQLLNYTCFKQMNCQLRHNSMPICFQFYLSSAVSRIILVHTHANINTDLSIFLIPHLLDYIALGSSLY